MINQIDFCAFAVGSSGFARGTGRPRWKDFLAQLDNHIRHLDPKRAMLFHYREEATTALLRRLAGSLLASYFCR